VIIINPVKESSKPSSQKFRWWLLLYFVVQNGVIIGGLDWLIAQLLGGRWPLFSTYFFVGLIIILTVIGYITATFPKTQRRQPNPDFEIRLAPKSLTLAHPDHPLQTVRWDDIARIDWQESHLPPAVLLLFHPGSATYKFFGAQAEGGPVYLRFELVSFDKSPVEIYQLLDYYWRNPAKRQDLVTSNE